MTNQPAAQPRIEGVFSIEKSVKIGTGTTAKRVKQSAYYYAHEDDNGVIMIQGLNANMVPFGKEVEISREHLLQDYLPEPGFYKEVMGKIQEVRVSLARGDKYRKRGELFTAEFEYDKALALEEQNVRANFGIGMCYLQRGEEEKAKSVFDRIVKIEAAFQDEHKHLFNEYGISLRKSKLVDEAVEYYRRALELTQNDENLWYNLARAEYELEHYEQCAEALGKCLELAPDHDEGKKFQAFLIKKQLI